MNNERALPGGGASPTTKPGILRSARPRAVAHVAAILRGRCHIDENHYSSTAAGNEYTGTRCVTRRNGGHSDVAVLQSPTMIAGLCVCDAGRSCGFCVGRGVRA